MARLGEVAEESNVYRESVGNEFRGMSEHRAFPVQHTLTGKQSEFMSEHRALQENDC